MARDGTPVPLDREAVFEGDALDGGQGPVGFARDALDALSAALGRWTWTGVEALSDRRAERRAARLRVRSQDKAAIGRVQPK